MVCPCLMKSFQQKEKLDDCTYFGRLFRRWSKFRNQTRSLTQLNTPSVVARFYWISTTQTAVMSYSISTLLTRNLHDVFGENDPARRRAGAIKATHPDFRYQPIAEPEELGNGGRIQWVSGPPGEAPVYAGTDFIIVRDGRIAAVHLFFDKLPEMDPSVRQS